ncbi:MAG: hypothetical protein KKA28_17830 [Planctomycetes bacterium]|nr:hypothetical protein [Planctomycetota bacterium]MCG2685391.1 hypothetical protein [Planctomycetales bacterium]
MQSVIKIPPTAEIRKNLAAAKAEARYLRRLLPIAQQQEEAARLRAEAVEKQLTGERGQG